MGLGFILASGFRLRLGLELGLELEFVLGLGFRVMLGLGWGRGQDRNGVENVVGDREKDADTE